MKNIEDLIIFGARKADMKNLRSIPNVGGVYFLCDDAEIIYIGHSEAMRERIRGHIRTKKVNGVLFLQYDGRIRIVFEKLFIQIFQPRLNRKKPDLPDNILSLLDKVKGITFGLH